MQTLTREEQETLRAILRRVFEEAAVETILRALDHLAARGERGTADLRRLIEVLEENIGRLRGEVNQLAMDHRSLEETLARLIEAQARTEATLARLIEAQARTEERLARVEEALARLAEAQARTEERVARLEEAQIRTEERLARVEEALARLAEAQARTEERVARLEEAQIRTEERLARIEEAQARNEERTARLEEGQRRLEEALARLAEAQARTEERVTRLERAMERMARQVGALSDVIGGDLEDAAYIVIHDAFTRELGWKVDVLERAHLRWDGHDLEVDLIGRAHDPARPGYEIWIVGETKYNITIGEVNRFARKLPMISRYLNYEHGENEKRLLIPVCFCYRARPEVRERIYNLGFHLVFSYGRIIWGKDGPPVSKRKRAAARKGRRSSAGAR